MKERLDILVCQKGLVQSREKAKSLIMAGDVFVDSQRVDKAGSMVDVNSNIEIKAKSEFVSRGGYKLKKAVTEFNIELKDKNCLDIGASTGGFTDCMLQNGAKHVVSIDVGYGQFDYSLRIDDRVTCMERTNIRYVTADMLPYMADFAAVDVSFISLTKVLPVIRSLMNENYEIVCLIKPQFEAGKENVGKNGVVRDGEVQTEVIMNVIDYAKKNGFKIKKLDFSPIKGPKGNIEFLLYLGNTADKEFDLNKIKQIVDLSKEKAK